MMDTISITCSDGQVLEVNREVANRMSPVIKKKFEGEAGTVTLDNVNSRALGKVMEYCNTHCNHPPNTDLKSWDSTFVKVEPSVLCELASAAYHLEIKPMVDLTCYAIAQLLKGNTPEEIRRIFNIVYDFGPDDDVPPPTMRDKLRNKWIRRSHARAADNQSVSPTTIPQVAQQLPVPPNDSPSIPTKENPDTRSVDELLSFINQNEKSKQSNSKGTKSVKKTKRKKDKRKGQESPKDISPSGQDSPQEETSPDNENRSLASSGEFDISKLGNSTFLLDDPETQQKTKSGEHYNHKNDHPGNSTSQQNGSCPGGGESLYLNSGGPTLTTLGDFTENGFDESDECIEVEDMDPELRALQDREVEEFRMRLEAAKQVSKHKIALPTALSTALAIALNSPKK